MNDRIALQTRAMLLRQVVQDIADKKIGIPAFQRLFVWTRQQVRDLFDSIRKGYPIGAIVLWESEYTLPLMDFLEDKPYESNKNVAYVLDGRQRLTAFYGCISRNNAKDSKFNLAYNLRYDRFEYPDVKKASDDLVVLISDIFDTFALIGILQHLSTKYESEPQLQTWLDRAKTLNSILQEYQCVVISIADCTIDQANKVFARINSKGTDIRKAEMFQATAYSIGAPLLNSSIKEIGESLKPLRFENLTDNVILNCYFYFAGKNFYDISTKSDPQEIERLRLTDYSEQVKEAVILTARFLREHCYIYDVKWLPYKHQFTALSHFFAKHKSPSKSEIRELRKWFFYTTASQSFANGSMTNLRSLFTHFNDYVEGRRTTPIEYTPFKLDTDFKFRVNAKSAKANFLILSLTRHYLHCANYIHNDFDVLRIGGVQATNYFVTFGQQDENRIRIILKTRNLLRWWDDEESDIEKFGLNRACVTAYHTSADEFNRLRTNLFAEYTKNLWAEVFPDNYMDFIP